MRRLLLCAAVALPVACGGSDYTAFANKCQQPRTGIDPITNQRYADQKGSVADEKSWLRGWIDDLYLWYREVPKDLKPENYQLPVDYFAVLKTPAKTPSGRDKDQFHFTFDTSVWEQLSQSGTSAGYGVEFGFTSLDVPRDVVAIYTEPDPLTPAAQNNITRGAHVVSVDGEPVATGDLAKVEAGLFPANTGETHVLVIQDRLQTTTRTVTMTSAAIASAPVQNAHLLPNTTIGYMLVNSFVSRTSEKALADAISLLKQQGATDLMLDLRYNGGGLVAIAAELAYMVAGPARTSGKTFEKTVFNDKYPNVDPVQHQQLAPMPFINTSVGFSVTSGQALPHLDLGTVYILTGGRTASASESVINGLLGADENVLLFGRQTRGKPYGFYPQDNCGTTYFSIQFEGQNNKGFGEYSDGFIPGGGGAAGPPGCIVADDFNHDLGDPAEGRLAAAINYRTSPTCPPPPARNALVEGGAAQEDVVLRSNPALENRIYVPWPAR